MCCLVTTAPNLLCVAVGCRSRLGGSWACFSLSRKDLSSLAPVMRSAPTYHFPLVLGAGKSISQLFCLLRGCRAVCSLSLLPGSAWGSQGLRAAERNEAAPRAFPQSLLESIKALNELLEIRWEQLTQMGVGGGLQVTGDVYSVTLFLC